MYKIGTYGINKISLSCFDDKRYILDTGIKSLVYLHREGHEELILEISLNLVYIRRVLAKKLTVKMDF